ncbi:protein of unknown function (plasmid) [Azospirillum baldaniorum]|uniref:Uncharacterized protein n=1 Tax=Azospirillum baldaniorum TaxID=1064539 RepID=A0A9P1NNH4_9PROT|nr:protein of unknown function [Azospirillum baldaniorum]
MRANVMHHSNLFGFYVKFIT